MAVLGLAKSDEFSHIKVQDIVTNCMAAFHAQGLSYTYNAFDGDHLTYLGNQIASALEFLSGALNGEEIE